MLSSSITSAAKSLACTLGLMHAAYMRHCKAHAASQLQSVSPSQQQLAMQLLPACLHAAAC